MPVTVYADSNIYRYIAHGELEVTTIGNVRFGYSQEHFDEIIRSGNESSLEAMAALEAVQVVSNESGEHDVDSIGVCHEYVDPKEKYDEYSQDMAQYQGMDNSMIELLLAFLGASNYQELLQVPGDILDLADEMSAEPGSADHARATKVAADLGEIIERDFQQPRILSETRKAFGLPKGATSLHGHAPNPIESIWSSISENIEGVTKDQFFGFEGIPGVDMQESRVGSVSACHLILNMVGLHPDKKLPKREKIRNIMSDGCHAGYATMCGVFLTADERLYKKVKAICTFRGFNTQCVFLPYRKDGMSISLAEPGSIRTVKLEKKQSLTLSADDA